MLITTTSNRNIFYVCYFCWWHAREVDPGHTQKYESTHGRKNWWTYFAHARLHWHLDYNCGCEFILMNDTWRSTPYSPEFTGPGLGPGIGPQVGTINWAPEQSFANISEQFFATCATPPVPPQLRFVCVISKAFDRENQWWQTQEIFWSKNQGYWRIRLGPA